MVANQSMTQTATPIHTSASDSEKAAHNVRLAFFLVLFVGAMVALSFAAVPLYKIFCSVTGYGGTTRVAKQNNSIVLARQMKVRFDSNISPGLAWDVQPAKIIKLKIGETHIINYTATNLGSTVSTATASFNVAPANAGYYFNKIQCFCFTEQTLAPGETVEMPVVFFLDPELAEDGDLDTLKEITLSYTFHATETPQDSVGIQATNNLDTRDTKNGGS